MVRRYVKTRYYLTVNDPKGVNNMLATLIPFFDKDMKVSAYSLFSQKENYLLNPELQGSAILSGSGRVSGLEILHNIGIDTLSPDTNVFIPWDRSIYFRILNRSLRI